MRDRMPLAVVFTLLLAAISAPHAWEDFSYDEFGRFGIAPVVAATALGAAYALQIGGAFLAGRKSRTGFMLLGAIGLVWFLGALFVHGPEIVSPGAYRSGFISKALEVGIIVLGAAVAVAGFAER